MQPASQEHFPIRCGKIVLEFEFYCSGEVTKLSDNQLEALLLLRDQISKKCNRYPVLVAVCLT